MPEELRRETTQDEELVFHPISPTFPQWKFEGSNWKEEEKRPFEIVFLAHLEKIRSPFRNTCIVRRSPSGYSIQLGSATMGASFSGETAQETANRLANFWNF